MRTSSGVLSKLPSYTTTFLNKVCSYIPQLPRATCLEQAQSNGRSQFHITVLRLLQCNLITFFIPAAEELLFELATVQIARD